MQIIETLTVAITFVGPRGSARLTRNESTVVKVLRDAGGKTVSVADIALKVWGDRPTSDPVRSVSTDMFRIRQKLRDVGIAAEIIETVPNLGFRFGG